jgi:hypothetical protein
MALPLRFLALHPHLFLPIRGLVLGLGPSLLTLQQYLLVVLAALHSVPMARLLQWRMAQPRSYQLILGLVLALALSTQTLQHYQQGPGNELLLRQIARLLQWGT